MLGGHRTVLRVRTARNLGGGAEKGYGLRSSPGQQDPPIAHSGAQHPSERFTRQGHQQRQRQLAFRSLRLSFTIGNLGLMMSTSGKCLKIFG